MWKSTLLRMCALLLMHGGAEAQCDRVFFGILHSHTAYSDGSGTPEQAYTRARDVAGLDFMAITEHNHKAAESGAGERADGQLIATDHALYEGPQEQGLIPTARRFNEDGRFVALYGQEFSSISKGNHVNVYEIDQVIPESSVPNGAFDKLLEFLGTHRDSQEYPAILQFNHPSSDRDVRALEYGKDDFGTDPRTWVARMGAQACTIEILNGPGLKREEHLQPSEQRESAYLFYLNLGFHLAPTADQDNHYANWGTLTEARTGVITDVLTKPKILEAIRNRRVYATTDRNLSVIFKVNGHLCGDRIPAEATDTPLNIEYRIEDPDQPEAVYQVDVFTDTVGGTAQATAAQSIQVNAGEPNGTIDDLRYTGGSMYLFFKVTRLNEEGDSDHAWTAPVWFEPTTPEAAITIVAADRSVEPGDNPEEFVASKRSGTFHVSMECLDAQSIKESNRITGPEAAVGRKRHVGCPRKGKD